MFRILAAALILASPGASFAQEQCKNVIFAAPENRIVVLVHTGEDETSLTEIREGVPRFCNASYSFGMGGYQVTCGDQSFPMMPVTDAGDIEYDGVILERQCAK